MSVPAARSGPSPGDLRARTGMTDAASPRSVLRMRKDARRRRWPYRQFNKYLDDLMIRAGIPLTSKGTPNTVRFEEMTGVSPSRVYYWRDGYNQPTLDSLRAIANGVAPHTGDDPRTLLYELEIAAGKRSPEERPPPEAPASLEGKVRRARAILNTETLTEQQRITYQALLDAYDRAYEEMLDQFFKRLEKDLKDTNKPTGDA